MSFIYLLFETIFDEKNKKLGYAILKNDHINLDNLENINLDNLENIKIINKLKLFLKKEKIYYTQIKIIQYLKNEVNIIYHQYFPIIISEQNNKLIYSDEKYNKKSIYNDDYDFDEYEYIYDSNVINNFNIIDNITSSEYCIQNINYLIDIENLLLDNKYNILKCVNILEDLLEKYDLDYWNDKENVMIEENLLEDEYKNELKKIQRKNNFINLKLNEIEKFKEHFNEDFLDSKLSDSEKKIKYYLDLYLLNLDDNYKLKLANQICRKFKYENLKKLKFNFTVNNYIQESIEINNIQQKIILSNKNNSIICTFQKDKIGDNKQGYTTSSYIKINNYDDLDDIIDEEILSELFIELEKYLF